MHVIPAIDLQGGKCVRLTQGEFDRVDTYSDDPAEFAREWQSQGAEILHVVDLDGARSGHPVNTEAIRAIVDAVSIPIQLGGGIRSLEAARIALDLGISRVIFGTAITKSDELAASLFEALKGSAVVGIDARNGFVAVDGWKSEVRELATEFALRMQTLGAQRIIFTDISRDGMLSGINMEALSQMALTVEIPVIASGGVSNLEDIISLTKTVRELSLNNVEAVIVGKALYTGALSLNDAVTYLTGDY